MHDANAQTQDYVQWGYARLPSRSFTIGMLALCHITHYVYITMDLDSIEIVAPKKAVKVLITVSSANNVKNEGIPDAAQLHDLKTAFGILAEHTTADSVCLTWEKRFLIILYGIVCFVGLLWECDAQAASS